MQAANGALSLPTKDGVYEVRDYPDLGATKRSRYFQVLFGEAREITDACLELDDVLEAVEISEMAAWFRRDDGAVEGRPSAADALRALDSCAEGLRESGDVEDALMELDKVRRVLEAMAGEVA